MQELLSHNINDIPLVFWAFMIALMLSMHFLAHTAIKGENTTNFSDNELAAIPILANDAAIR